MELFINKISEDVLEELISKYDLYKKQTIAYEYREDDEYKGIYFKEMYEEYKEQCTEVEFASILHISKTNFTSGLKIKNRGIILSKRTIKINENELKNYLKNKYKLEKDITYITFLDIYQELKTYFTEVELAAFMGIKKQSLNNIKYGRISKTSLDLYCSSEQKIDMEILEKLGEKYNIYKEQPIAYEYKENDEYKGPYFKEMYEEYKDKYTQEEFAQILGITKENFNKGLLKGKKRRILKHIILTKEEKENILNEIIKKFNLYKGQCINKQLFYEMLEQYKLKLSKKELAEMLGISEKSLGALGTSNAKILMNRQMSEEEKERTLETLIIKYNLYKKQLIKYEFEEGDEYKGPYFVDMFEEYKSYFTIIEFADLLQMNNNGTSLPIRYNKGRSEILGKRELTEEDKKQITETIVKRYEGVLISYKKENEEGISFKKLHELYKSKSTEKEFAECIGILSRNFEAMRYEGRNTVIKDYNLMRRVASLIPNMERRFYTKEEIKTILDKYNITLKEFIMYVINKSRNFITDKCAKKYEIALDKNNGLYVGHMKMNNEYIEQNYKDLQRISRIISRRIYNQFSIDKDKVMDLTSDILKIMIENYGDIVGNFGYDKDLALGLLYSYTIKRTVSIFSENTYYDRTISLNKKIYGGKKELIDEYGQEDIGFKKVIEAIEINNTKNMQEEKLIGIFKNFLLNGYSPEEIINNVSRIFNIDKKQMLESMQAYLINNGKVKMDEEGRVIRAEEII